MSSDGHKWYCTICGLTKAEVIENGCGEPEPRYVEYGVQHKDGTVEMVKDRVRACPMELRPWWRRFLFYTLGVHSWNL